MGFSRAPTQQRSFIMSDPSRRPCVQAKLKELIEQASSVADANLHRRRKPYPLGYAVRAEGSKFAFEPENIEDNDAVVALIRTLFLQHNVVCYVLTLGAVSEGKQYVLFFAEDESGPMVVGHREVIMRPAPHLGPLEIIDSNFAEGRFVGLLPRQATPGMQ